MSVIFYSSESAQLLTANIHSTIAKHVNPYQLQTSLVTSFVNMLRVLYVIEADFPQTICYNCSSDKQRPKIETQQYPAFCATRASFFCTSTIYHPS